MGILQFAYVSDHLTVPVAHYSNRNDDLHLHDDSNEFRAIREDWTYLQIEGLFLHHGGKFQVSTISKGDFSQFFKKGKEKTK